MFASAMRAISKAPLLVLAASLTHAARCQGQQLPRIGVLYFNLGQAAAQSARTNLGVSGNLGGDFATVVVTELGAGHKFEVIDMNTRPEIQKELAYLNGANIDPNTAARLGKELGEQMVLTGTITELSGGTSTGGMSVYRQTTSKVHVVADVQVIDVETHRVLETAEGIGDKSDTKRGVSIPGSSGASMIGSSFGNGLLQQAAKQAIDQIVQKLEASHYLTAAAATPPPPPAERHAYEGTVADVAGSTVIFTIPSADVAKVGDMVVVKRVVRTIPDPNDPKKVLRTITDTAATAKVTEVDTASSTGTAQIVSGTVKVKDKISFKP